MSRVFYCRSDFMFSLRCVTIKTEAAPEKEGALGGIGLIPLSQKNFLLSLVYFSCSCNLNRRSGHLRKRVPYPSCIKFPAEKPPWPEVTFANSPKTEEEMNSVSPRGCPKVPNLYTHYHRKMNSRRKCRNEIWNTFLAYVREKKSVSIRKRGRTNVPTWFCGTHQNFFQLTAP